MIIAENHLGTINITEEFFASLIGNAAASCFGVKGMISNTPIRSLRSVLLRGYGAEKGVEVINDKGKLIVNLHIAITYGVNISEVVKSIIHKVRFTVEETTGLVVEKVNVYVDKMSS